RGRPDGRRYPRRLERATHRGIAWRQRDVLRGARRIDVRVRRPAGLVSGLHAREADAGTHGSDVEHADGEAVLTRAAARARAGARGWLSCPSQADVASPAKAERRKSG